MKLKIESRKHSERLINKPTAYNSRYTVLHLATFKPLASVGTWYVRRTLYEIYSVSPQKKKIIKPCTSKSGV